MNHDMCRLNQLADLVELRVASNDRLHGKLGAENLRLLSVANESSDFKVVCTRVTDKACQNGSTNVA